jgi:sugar phosphate isomerase/epimerase
MEPSIIALLTDALEDHPLEAVAEWCAARGIGGLELGVGGYSAAPHVAALRAGADLAGLGVVALNASGNPLHPDREVREAHDAALRTALQLAAELGVPRVVAMSGCPGSGDWPVFAGGAWLPDMEGLWERQWPQIAAYWEKLSAWAPSGVDICLELHPGTSIYNAASFALLAGVTGSNVKVNLDPSHFWWQGIDPVVAVLALHGVLDFRWPADADTMPWHFCAVGHGRPLAEWRALFAAIAEAGYDGPVSIEHEDPRLDVEAGIEASLEGLRAALAAEVRG